MQNKELSEEQLLISWINGDEKAFERLFRNYFHKLYLFAAKQINDEELAKEMVMDVMLRLWQSKDACRQVQSLSSYLYGAVKNAIIDHYRKKALDLNPLEDAYQEALSTEEADTRLIDEEYEYILNRGIEQLTPQRQLIFKLKREKNLSHAEIAQQLSISPKTIESHMTAAISFLRTYINQQTGWMLPIVVLLFLI